MNHLKRNLQFIASIFVIVIFVFLVSNYSRPEASSNNLKIYFLNVGQGDSEYIKTPSGQDILIDGGPDTSVLNELGKVMDFGDREINLVILSHPHADHLTGLLEVINRFKVDEVWETGVDYPSATYDNWRSEISAKQIPDKIVKAGESKNFGEAKISILYPLSPLENKKIDNLNNASIVSRLDYKKFSVLYMGDLEKDAQTKVLNQNLFATILKVAHHGSSNGLSEDILKVIRPVIAVIEVGKDNTYGHPAPSVINLLKQYAVRIYRTDQNGTVEITSDGKGYWVK